MKKVILLAVVAVAVFSSCRKTRTCECTYTSGNSSYTDTHTTPRMTKTNAETWCSAQVNGYYYTSCTLK